MPGILARAIAEVCEGQIIETGALGRPTPSRVRTTSAPSLSRPERSSRPRASLAARPRRPMPDVRAALNEYGEHLGLAFQMVDDLIDLVGDPDVTGKMPGNGPQGGRLHAGRPGRLRAGPGPGRPPDGRASGSSRRSCRPSGPRAASDAPRGGRRGPFPGPGAPWRAVPPGEWRDALSGLAERRPGAAWPDSFADRRYGPYGRPSRYTAASTSLTFASDPYSNGKEIPMTDISKLRDKAVEIGVNAVLPAYSKVAAQVTDLGDTRVGRLIEGAASPRARGRASRRAAAESFAGQGLKVVDSKRSAACRAVRPRARRLPSARPSEAARRAPARAERRARSRAGSSGLRAGAAGRSAARRLRRARCRRDRGAAQGPDAVGARAGLQVREGARRSQHRARGDRGPAGRSAAPDLRLAPASPPSSTR